MELQYSAFKDSPAYTQCRARDLIHTKPATEKRNRAKQMFLSIMLMLTMNLLLINNAHGQIIQQTAWTKAYDQASGTGNTISFPIASGSNRILVVGVTASFTSSSGPTINTLTYGGVTLTSASSNMSSSGHAHTALYFLKDNAVMDGTSRLLSVALNSTPVNMTVWYAVFAGVNQSPPSGSYTSGNGFTNTSGSGPAQLSASMAVNTNDQAVYMTSIQNASNTTIPTYAINANWTSGGSNTGSSGDAWRNEVATRAIPVSSTTDNAATGTIAPANSNRWAMSAMSLAAVPTVPILTITGATNHGNTCLGSSATSITYTITNNGTTASGVTVTSSDPQFVVSNLSSATINSGGGTATYQVIFTPSASGAKSATITVASTTVGSNSPTSSLTGTGVAAPTAVAGTAISTCSNSGAVNITAGSSASNNASVVWTSNGTGTFTNATSLTTATYTPSAADITAGSRILTLTANGNAGCSNVTSTKTITITQAPANPGNPTSNSPQCNTVTLTAPGTPPVGETWYWQTSATGTSTANSGTTNSVTTSGTYYIRSQNLTGCWSAAGSLAVTVSPTPTANAGSALSAICHGGTSAALGGSVSGGTTTGIWSDGGIGGTFNPNATTLNATWAPPSTYSGTATLTLTPTGGSCTGATASKNLLVNPSPTVANAGSNQVLCGTTSTVLAANAPSIGAGAWTITSGTGGSVTTASSATSPFSGVLGSTYTLTWTISNSPCTASTSTVTIKFNQSAPSASGVAICQGETDSSKYLLTSSTTCPLSSPIASPSKDAGAAADNGAVGTVAWGNTGNITTTGVATVAPAAGASSHYLIGTSYGFSIPTNATINGIQVTINRSSSTATFGTHDNDVQLVKGGAIQSTNKALTTTYYPTALTSQSYGTVSDLWTNTWTPADVNAANFGVALSVINPFVSATVSVDYMQISITYTLPGSTDWYTVSSGGTLIGSGTSFNPVGVANSGLSDTNTAATTAFYAECSTVPGCRTAVNFVINPLPVLAITDPLPACSPGTVDITADAVTAGSTGSGVLTYWIHPDATAALGTAGAVVDPGIYYIKSTTTAGCSDIKPVNVTVNQPPTVTLGANSYIYDGLAKTATVSTDSGAAINWYDAALTPISFAPTETNAGTYVFYADATNSLTGCKSAGQTEVDLFIDVAQLTATANPDEKIYDGMSYSFGNGVVYTGFVPGENSSVVDESSLIYFGSSQGATDAGPYDIWPYGMVSANYNINPQPGTLTIDPAEAHIEVTPYSVDYDGSLHTATGTATGVNGEILDGLDLSETAHANAGDYSGDTWTFTSPSINYKNASGIVPDAINKVPSTIVASGAITFTYNGSAQGPAASAITGSTEQATYSYSGTTNGNVAYGPSSTAPTLAGSYQMIASVETDGNFNAKDSDPYSFTIIKATSTIVATGLTAFGYNGSTQGPATSTVIGSTGAVTYSYSGTTSGSVSYGPSTTLPTEIGNYQVIASVAADDNYLAQDSDALLFTIGKGTSTIVATGDTAFAYIGSPQGPASSTVTGSTAVATYGYSGTTNGNITYGPSATAPTLAGSYQMIASVAADDNYLAQDSDPLLFTIGKGVSTIIVTGNTSFIYTGSTQGPTSSTVTGSTAVPTYSYSGTSNGNIAYGPSATAPILAGSYQVIASIAADDNYSVQDSNPFSFTIGKGTSTIVATGDTTYTYTGLTQGPNTSTATGSSAVPTYSYSGTSNGNIAYGPSATAPTLAGSYQMIASVAADDNYLAQDSDPMSFTIGKATSTIVATGETAFTYSGSAQGPAASAVTGSTGLVTYSYSGTANGNIVYGPSATAPTLGGSYRMIASVAADDNYLAQDSDPLLFTIGKGVSTIVGTGETTFTFSGSTQGPATSTVTGSTGLVTYSYSGTTNGSAPYGPSATAPTLAGSYQMIASVAADDNYLAQDSDPLLFTIGKAASTTVVAIIGGPFVYTSLAQTPATVTVTGAGGLNLTSDANYANNVNAGNATASYTFDGDNNHLSSSDSKNFVIGKATPTVTLSVSNSPGAFECHAQSAKVGISSSSVPGTVINALTGGAVTQTTAGIYAVTASFVPDDSANYNALTGLSAGNFVIGARPGQPDKVNCWDVFEWDMTNCVWVNIGTQPVGPTASAQSFFAPPTVANLVPAGANIKWYSTPTGGMALATNSIVTSGMYYVSQISNGCESARTAVSISTTPTDVEYCKGDVSVALTAVQTSGTSLTWYTAATGGNPSYTAFYPATSVVGTKYYYVSQDNGVTRVKIGVTINALPSTPGVISGTTTQGALVGTATTATYSIAPVAGAVSYVWSAPTGVTIDSAQGTTSITVDFYNVTSGAGVIGNLSVIAVNALGCNSVARTLSLTKDLPIDPAKLTMTDGVTTTAITDFGKYIGQPTVLTITATSVATATSYVWELPAGVNQLSGDTSNVITINFAGVATGTTLLRIGAKAKNGTGVSITNNSTLVPPTSSTARLLTLTAAPPAAPANVKLTNGTTNITDVSIYIGTSASLTLTVAPVATASSYDWELPIGVNQMAGGNSNVITVNFAGVPAGTTYLYLGARARNGVGVSTTYNGSLVPATSSTYTLLKVTSSVPAAVTAVAGQVVGVCGGNSYHYVITPTVLANSYTVVAPVGSTVAFTNNLEFDVLYPANLAYLTKTVTVYSVNGVGQSTSGKSLAISTSMPAIGTVTGSAGIRSFQRCVPQSFSIPDVVGATYYLWQVADGATLTGQGTASIIVDFSAVDAKVSSTKVTVTAINTCGVSSAVKTTILLSAACPNVTAKSVDSPANESLMVYPNPVIDMLNIKNVSVITSIDIFNLLGQHILSVRPDAVTTMIDMGNLPVGTYLLEIQSEGKTTMVKVIKNQ